MNIQYCASAMKKLFISAACLFAAVFSYSQTTGSAAASANGIYSFSKATVTISNYNTKAEVLTRTFNDSASLEELGGISFPHLPVFLSATVQDSILNFCRLWNDRNEYAVQENGHLLVPVNHSSDNPEMANEDIFLHEYRLSPLYTLKTDGNTAVFTFTEPYGSSAYNFPLTGKLEVTLVKL